MEKMKRYPSSEGFKQALTDLGKATFIGCEISGIDSSISGGWVDRDEARISLVYGVEKPDDCLGEIIFGIKQEDMRTLKLEVGKVGRVIVYPAKVSHDGAIISPLSEAISGRKIRGVDFDHPSSELSRFTFVLDEECRLILDVAKGTSGRVMVKEKGVYQGELLLPTGFYLRPNEGPTEG